MKSLSLEQYNIIHPYLPVQRGNVKISNFTLINAIYYIVENGCKWRCLPKEFGNWHTIYMRISRWAKNKVLDRLFEVLQKNNMIHIKVKCLGLDSTFIKVHPDGTGALKKNGPQSIGKSRGGWTTKIHLVSQNDRNALNFSLSAGNKMDAGEGCILLSHLQKFDGKLKGIPLVMDRAYEDEKTRKTAINLGVNPVVPPKSNRLNPWKYNRKTYKKRNELERLFRRLKGFKRIFCRFDKLDIMFKPYIHFVLIILLIA